jgi:hypothetical protein
MRLRCQTTENRVVCQNASGFAVITVSEKPLDYEWAFRINEGLQVRTLRRKAVIVEDSRLGELPSDKV